MQIEAAEWRPHVVGIEHAFAAGERERHQASHIRHAARFVSVNVRLRIEQDFVAGVGMRHQRTKIPHRAADHQQGRLLAEHFGRQRFESGDGRILVERVVAQRRVPDRLEHLRRGKSLGVATEIEQSLNHKSPDGRSVLDEGWSAMLQHITLGKKFRSERMQVVITAVGPDNRGLADPIVHHVTGSGANIHEIQMYDHDSEQLFAMLLRVEWPGGPESIAELAERMNEVGRSKGLSLRTWSRERSRTSAAIWRCARPIGRSRRWPCCEPSAMDAWPRLPQW